MTQQEIDAQNAEFWNELCGSSLARSLGITEASPESLRRFDQAYLEMYPYLEGYVSGEDLRGKSVLEIGLGYGTLGGLLASRGCDYYGLDIAPNAVEVMRYRLAQMGQNDVKKVQVGSALEIPHDKESFDFVYSIGCLHHTGNLSKSMSEVYRVLVPGGRAIVMLYNRHSFRQLVQMPLARMVSLLGFNPLSRRYPGRRERIRAFYDTDPNGQAAPHTDFVSRKEVRQLFKDFASLRIDVRNFDNLILWKRRVSIPRERLLNNVGRVLGLDLYILATKYAAR